MVKLKAAGVAAKEMPDMNVFVVIFSENADGSGRRLELQRSLTVDDGDVALGMDTYCLCTEAGAAHYGGVTSWSLNNHSLVIRLTASAEAALCIEDGISIGLDLTATEQGVLHEALNRVLN